MKRRINKKKITAFILSFLFIMQQSLAYQVLAASEIIDGAGNPINKTDGDFNIRPDGWHGSVGFKEFDKINLEKGDTLNFIYQWMQQNQTGSGNDSIHNYTYGDISTFVNLVNNGVNINGIINTLNSDFGFTPGNLVFISPNGMVVGASGVLNVGSLSVLTPEKNSYESFKNSLGLPKGTQYAIEKVDAEGNPTYATSSLLTNAKELSVGYDPSGLDLQNGTGVIQIDGRIAARGDVNLQGASVNIGDNAKVLAGVKGPATNPDGSDPNVLQSGPTGTAEQKADNLFNLLVNADNMDTGNEFANSDGNIIITSNAGTSVGTGALVRNYGQKGDITITNTGANGVTIKGEVSNPNGELTIDNSAGGINIASGAEVLNKGTMTINNTGSNGIVIAGLADNNGTMNITNSGTNGININGTASNNGDLNITNKNGDLNINTSGRVTNTGTTDIINQDSGKGILIAGTVDNNGTLNITNETGSKGIDISGTVENDTGIATILNKINGIDVTSSGKIVSNGTELNIENHGSDGTNIQGLIQQYNKGIINIDNYNSNVVIGDNTTNDNYISSNGTVNINVENGNLLNSGVNKTLVKTTEDADLNITVANGTIGTDPAATKGSIGTDARDLTKSFNVSIDGKITSSNT